jgi:hypothetical protein
VKTLKIEDLFLEITKIIKEKLLGINASRSRIIIISPQDINNNNNKIKIID